MKKDSKRPNMLDGLNFSNGTQNIEASNEISSVTIGTVESSSKHLETYKTNQGKKGMKMRRMNVAMTDDAYIFISREARKNGMTHGEYIYSLAKAASEGKINL